MQEHDEMLLSHVAVDDFAKVSENCVAIQETPRRMRRRALITWGVQEGFVSADALDGRFRNIFSWKLERLLQ